MNFSEKYRTNHTQNFKDNPSEEWLANEEMRLRSLAKQSGFDMMVSRKGHGFYLSFVDRNERTEFLEQAGYSAGPDIGAHQVTEHFAYPDPKYMSAWAESVRELAAENGIFPVINVLGDKVEVRFDTMRQHDGFMNTRDQGVFDRMAQDKISRNWTPSERRVFN